jgi:hypothetical protein
MPGQIGNYTNGSSAGYHINGDYFDNGTHCFISNGVITATIGLGGVTGNGSGLMGITSASLTNAVSTNYTLTAGPTLYITNGLIIKIQ